MQPKILDFFPGTRKFKISSPAAEDFGLFTRNKNYTPCNRIRWTRWDMVKKVDKLDRVNKVDKMEKMEKVDKPGKVYKVGKVDWVDMVGKVNMVDKKILYFTPCGIFFGFSSPSKEHFKFHPL